MQHVSIIVAAAPDGAIGRDNRIPWHLPADLARFKRLTMGHAIVMGRRTHKSIGRPLTGRRNIVITRQRDYRAEGCEVVGSLDAALAAAGDGEVFVIGGAAIYREALPRASRIYLTRVEGTFEADTFFPEIDERVWREVERVRGMTDDKNRHPHEFLLLERIREVTDEHDSGR
jgi:dihydrofolate reductase